MSSKQTDDAKAILEAGDGSSDDLLNAVLQGIGSAPAAESPLLGVEPGFVARGGAAPVFTEASVDDPAKRSVEEIKRLQIRMAKAGVLPSSAILGVWDDTSRTAYRMVLSVANRHGISDDVEAVDFIGKQIRETGEAVAEGALPSARPVTSAVDLQQIMEQVSVELTGQKLDPATQDRLVAAYQGVEAAPPPTSGTFERPPDPSTFAADQIEQMFPGRVRGADFLDRSFEFFGLLDGVV